MRLRRSAAVIVATVVALSVAWSLAAQPPKRQTVTGVVVDIASYIAKGEQGPDHAEAGKFRADSGFPVGILDTTSDTLYIAVYRDPAPASGLHSANEQLAPLMGKEVVTQGRVYEKSGVKLIEIAIVSEM